MSLGMEVGLGPGDFVLDRDPGPPSLERGRIPLQIFGPCLLWPNGWMDQDGTWHGGRPQPRLLCVRWTKPCFPQKGGGVPYPIFGKFLLCPNGWMHHDATWYGVGLSPGDFVFDEDPAPSPKRGWSPLPNFQSMSIVAKRLDGSRWHLAWRWALVQATLC